MRILICNDDGIDAPGIRALEARLPALGEVWVVAPDGPRSAQSHALTMHKPLRARPSGPRRFSVSGTPADCVYLALHELMDGPPDVVVSGVNDGGNLGNDIFYSGTVAAAREAALGGYPAIAVSLHREPGDLDAWFETAAEVTARATEAVLTRGLPPRVLLNINVPNVAPAALKGVRAAPMGRREYAPLVEARHDPRGVRYYWIGGPEYVFADIEGSDGPVVEAGWAAVTPIHCELTLTPFLEDLRGWTDA